MNPGFRQSSQQTFISEKTPFPIFNICPRRRADHFTEDCLEILAGLCEGETTWWNTLLCPKFQLVQGRNLLFSTIWIELSSGGHRTLLEISGLKFLNSKGSTCQSVSSCLHEFMNKLFCSQHQIWIHHSCLPGNECVIQQKLKELEEPGICGVRKKEGKGNQTRKCVEWWSSRVCKKK